LRLCALWVLAIDADSISSSWFVRGPWRTTIEVFPAHAKNAQFVVDRGAVPSDRRDKNCQIHAREDHSIRFGVGSEWLLSELLATRPLAGALITRERFPAAVSSPFRGLFEFELVRVLGRVFLILDLEAEREHLSV